MAVPDTGDVCNYFRTADDWGGGSPGTPGWNPVSARVVSVLSPTTCVIQTLTDPPEFYGPVAAPNFAIDATPVVLTALPFVANSCALTTAQAASQQAAAFALAAGVSAGEQASKQALDDDTPLPLLVANTDAAWSYTVSIREWRQRNGNRTIGFEFACPGDVATYTVRLKDHTSGAGGVMSVQVLRVEKSSNLAQVIGTGASVGDGTIQEIVVTCSTPNDGLHLVQITTGADNTPNNPALRYAVLQVWRTA